MAASALDDFGLPEGFTLEVEPTGAGGPFDLPAGFEVETPAPTAASSAPPAAPAPAAGPAGGMDAYAKAIASIESAGSGDYAAVGPRHRRYGRALGRYQVMEANLPQWLAAAGLPNMTGDEFLADPKAQDALFQHRFGEYVRKYGPEGAARAWFAGEGGMNKLARQDVLGTSVADYSRKFTTALGAAPQGAPAAPASPVGPPVGPPVAPEPDAPLPGLDTPGTVAGFTPVADTGPAQPPVAGVDFSDLIPPQAPAADSDLPPGFEIVTPAPAPAAPPGTTGEAPGFLDHLTRGLGTAGGLHVEAAKKVLNLPTTAVQAAGALIDPNLSPAEREAAGAAELETAEWWAPVWRSLADVIPEQYRNDPQTVSRIKSASTEAMRLMRAGDSAGAMKALGAVEEDLPLGYHLVRHIHGLLESHAREAEGRRDRARKMMRGQLPLPSITYERNLFNTGARTLAESFTSSWLQYLGILQGHGQEALGLGDADDTTLYRFGQTVEDRIKQAFPADPARQFEFSNHLAQGLASTTAFFGQGAIARMLKAGTAGQLAVMGLAGAAFQTPDEFERVTKAIEEDGATARDRLLITAANTFAGFTEMAPFVRTFAGRGVRGLKGALSRGAEQATEEAVQELTQTLIQNNARRIYDASQDPYEGALQGAFIGLMTGGLFGMGLSQSQANSAAKAAIQRGRALGFEVVQRGRQAEAAGAAVTPDGPQPPQSPTAAQPPPLPAQPPPLPAQPPPLPAQPPPLPTTPPPLPTAEEPAAAATAPPPEAPTAEPIEDLIAQAHDLADPGNPRQGLYLSAANIDALADRPEGAMAIRQGLEPLGVTAEHVSENFDGKGGFLIARTPALRARAERQRDRRIAAGEDPNAVIQDILGTYTGAGTGKPSPVTPEGAPAETAIVQQVTPEGAVTRESVVTPETRAQTEADLAAPGRDVRTVPVEEALARREEGTAPPPVAPASDPQSAPDSAFNGDLAYALERVFLSPDFDGQAVPLGNVGFTPDEIVALESAGLAADGQMTRSQWAAWEAERSRRLNTRRTTMPRRSQAAEPAAPPIADTDLSNAARGPGSPAAPVKAQTAEDVDAASARVPEEPTEGQREAGNYRKGHINVQGLPISIETPKGAIRRGDGWEAVSPAAYGYFKGPGVKARARDGEHPDVYVGDNPASDRAYIIDQYEPGPGGRRSDTFDEPKVVMGVGSHAEAIAIYDASFSDGSGPSRRGMVTEVSIAELKDWLREGNATVPYAELTDEQIDNILDLTDGEIDKLVAAWAKARAAMTEPPRDRMKLRLLGEIHERLGRYGITVDRFATETQVRRHLGQEPEAVGGRPEGDRGEAEARPAQAPERPGGAPVAEPAAPPAGVEPEPAEPTAEEAAPLEERRRWHTILGAIKGGLPVTAANAREAVSLGYAFHDSDNRLRLTHLGEMTHRVLSEDLAAGAEPAPAVEPQAEPPDPNAFSALKILRTEGEDALRARLAAHGTLEDLQALAKAQQAPRSAWTAPTVEEAIDRIVAAMKARLADQQAFTPQPEPEAEAASEAQESPFERATREAKEYVLAQGRKDGLEHGVTVRPDGTSITAQKTPANSSSFIEITPVATPELFRDEDVRTLEFHHNHPSSRAFSLNDIWFGTAVKALKTLHAHGHNGSSYRVDFLIEPTDPSGTSENQAGQRAMRAHNHVHRRLQNILATAVQSGTVAAEDVGAYRPHLVCLLLDQAGLIRYSYEFANPEAAEATVARLRQAIARISGEWDEIAAEARKEADNVPDRPPGSVRAGERVEGAPSAAPGDQRPEQRPDKGGDRGRGADASGGGGARGADQLKDYTGVVIDGYQGELDPNQEIAFGSVKRAFLTDARNYLTKVAKALEERGFKPFPIVKRGRGGKTTEKPGRAVNVNRAGPAVSGDVYLDMIHADGHGVQIQITGDAPREGGAGIALIARAKGRDGRLGPNNWWRTDLAAGRLAEMAADMARKHFEVEAQRVAQKSQEKAQEPPEAQQQAAGAPDLNAAGEWWRHELNRFGRRDVVERLGLPERVANTLWQHIGRQDQEALARVYAEELERHRRASEASRRAEQRVRPAVSDDAQELIDEALENIGLPAGTDLADLPGGDLRRVHRELRRMQGERPDPDLTDAIRAVVWERAQDRQFEKRQGKLPLASEAGYQGPEGREDAAESQPAAEPTAEPRPADREPAGPDAGPSARAEAGPPVPEAVGGPAPQVPGGEPSPDAGLAPGERGVGRAPGGEGDRGGADVRGGVGPDEGTVAGRRDAEPEARPVPADTSRGRGDRPERERVRAVVEETRRKVAQTLADRARANYRITEDDEIGKGGAKAKVRANIEAIRTLRRIEEERREANAEEKRVLVKYVGWGAFAQDVFAEHKAEWAKERQQLRDLLSEEEYEAARRSTLNAHYTSVDVIKGMWAALDHLGFGAKDGAATIGARVLEPSAGVGHFIGLAPEVLRDHLAWTAVELDPVTGGILRALYGGADVRVQGFETVNWPDGHFDLAISNVPFGQIPIRDTRYKRGFNIHDYFFVKALDKLRPGGIVAFITSRYTLDKVADSARREIAKRATFLGAIRLPGGKKGAFAGNAGTEVTTDIIFLRRRMEGEPEGDQSWLDLKEIKTPDGKVAINAWLADHPEAMLGKMRLIGSQYTQNEPVLIGSPENLDARIAEAAAAVLPADAFVPRAPTSVPVEQAAIDTDTDGIKEGAYYEKEGTLYRKVAGVGQPLKAPKPVQDRVRAFMAIREIVNDLLARQSRGEKEGIADLRQALADAYDAFVKKFGPINLTKVTEQRRKDGKTVTITRYPNLAAFRDDPDAFKVAAIENYDVETGKASKASIFSADIIGAYERPAISGPADALAVSLNELGRVDMPFIATLLGTSEEEAIAHVGDRAYLDPNGETWRMSDQYLSGDVVTKLEEARVAAETDPRYERNVKALRDVQPVPLTREDILIPPGAPWVPAEDYETWLREVLDISYGPFAVRINPVTKTWSVEGQIPAAAQAQFGTEGMGAAQIAEHVLNSQMIRITYTVKDPDGSTRTVFDKEATEAAQAKAAALKATWTGDEAAGISPWAWREEERAQRLEADYNANFNRLVPFVADGSHLTLPGLAKTMVNGHGQTVPLELRPHQKNVVWRTIVLGNTLFDHVVGAGKTIAMVASAMEQKRLGLVQRPMVVVPNHMLEQFSREWLQAYPNAKLLIADKDSMSKDRRKEFAARVAAERWDGIVITHSAFGRIRMSDQAYKDHYKEQIDEVIDALADELATGARKTDPTVKQLEQMKARIEAQQARLSNKERKDEGITFEEMGVDFIYVDEAHLFKNLHFMTRHGRLKGLATAASQRATDLFLKIRAIEKSRPGRAVVFATGTPVSNTMAEMYTMQRYLQLDELQRFGLDKFDAWAATFGDITSQIEVDVDGRSFKPVTSFSRFVNIPELVQLYSRVADTQTADMLNLPRPKLKDGTVKVIEADLSPAEEAYMTSLVERAEAVRAGGIKPEVDNMLKIMSEGRKLATDFRLLFPETPFNPDGKITKAVDNIVAIYERGTASKKKKGAKAADLAQIVFLDMGVPGRQRKATEKPKAPRPTVEAEADARIEQIRDAIRKDNIVARDGAVDEDTETAQADARESQELFVGNFNLYDDIRDRLVARGVPAKEIAYIHDAKTDEAKNKLFAKVRSGEVRILLGSTGKMGVGTNVQTRLVAMHHLDAPWKPAEVEQRDGRILRQGNLNPEVEIYRYITRRSLDAFMWQTLERKAGFIAQVRAGAKGIRTAEDIDSPLPEAAAIKAAASGDPRILEHAELSKEVKELEAGKRGLERTVQAAKQSLAATRAAITATRERLGKHELDATKVTDTSGDKFSMTLAIANGKRVTERRKAADAIKAYVLRLAEGLGHNTFSDDVVGTISGFQVEMRTTKTQQTREGKVVQVANLALRLRGPSGHAYSTGMGFDVTEDSNLIGLIRRMENIVADVPTHAEAARQALVQYQADVPKLEAQTKPKPFPKEARLLEAKARLAELTKVVEAKEPEGADTAPPTAPPTEGTDGGPGALYAIGPKRKPLSLKGAAAEKAKAALEGQAAKRTREAQVRRGVFPPNAPLASWAGLPLDKEFYADVAHIATKRGDKDDVAIHGDLSTPEAVFANIEYVLANATHAFRYYVGEESWVLVAPSPDGDRVVGYDAARLRDGRVFINTSFIARPGTMEARLLATLDRQGRRAFRWNPRAADEILTLLRQAPPQRTGNKVKLIADIERRQARQPTHLLAAIRGAGAEKLDVAAATAAMREDDVRAEARRAVKRGKAWRVPQETPQAILGAIEADPVARALPAPIGALTQVAPVPGQPGMVQLDFAGADGAPFSFNLPESVVFGGSPVRAFTHPGGAFIALVNFTTPPLAGKGLQTLVGGAYHEVTHALERAEMLPAEAFVRLVKHAHKRRVLDLPVARVMRAIGFDPTGSAGTLRNAYTQLYGRNATQAALDSEAAAHFVELDYHGYWSEDQRAPVKDILDAIYAGTYAGRPAAGAARTAVLAGEAQSIALAIQQGEAQRRELDALGFKSRALEAAKAWQQPKGTPDQILQHLLKAGAGVKNELEAIGLNAFLQGKKSVTRDEVVSFLRERRVEVREAVYGGEFPGGLSVDMDQLEDFLTPEEAARARAAVQPAGPARWRQHSLARDDNNPSYSETVLHLAIPSEIQYAVRERPDGAFEVARTDGVVYSPPAGLTRDVAERLAAEGNANTAASNARGDATALFRSGHFPEPNVIGHVQSSLNRLKGKITYAISQIQSDWGQQIRDMTRDAVARELFGPESAWGKARIAEAQRLRDEAFARFEGISEPTRDDIIARNRADSILVQARAFSGRFADLSPDQKAQVSAAISEARNRGEVPAGVRDEAKIAELRKRLEAAVAKENRLTAQWERAVGPDEQLENERFAAMADVRRMRAELQTAEAAVPHHPMVATTDQWLTTTLRHVIRQAIAAGADSIAIPSGDTVLAYNPQGSEEGNADFYNNIVPKTLAKILKGYDKSIRPTKVDKIQSPVDGRDLGSGFTVFPITDQVRDAVTREGQWLFAIRAFHASPHDFDRFSAEFIGTGEGAQTFGYGLYFAEAEATGESYLISLPPRSLIVGDGRRIPFQADKAWEDYSSEEKAAFTLRREMGGRWLRNRDRATMAQALDAAIASQERYLAENRHFVAIRGGNSISDMIEAETTAILNVLRTWKEQGVDVKNTLYEVSIDVEPEQLLDWDKPLGEQSEQVRDAILASTDVLAVADPVTRIVASLRGDPKWSFGRWDEDRVWAHMRRLFPQAHDEVLEEFADRIQSHVVQGFPFDSMLGQELVRALGMKKEATDKLLAAGIPGIRYQDAGSRGQEGGTYNYVIFDDSLVKIVAKDGKPVEAQERADVLQQMHAEQEGGPPAEASAIPTPRISPEARESLERDITEIVARIAGKDVEVRLVPGTIPTSAVLTPAQQAAYGDLAEETVGGFYRGRGRTQASAVPLIALAMGDPAYLPRTVAGHEAFHHVETALASEAERRLLDLPSELNRMRTRYVAPELGRDPSDPALQAIPAREIRAIAFQRYRRMREEGMQPAFLHIGIRRLWDRINRVFQGVRNVLKGHGYASFEDIFERARTGEMARRAETGAPATGAPFAASMAPGAPGGGRPPGGQPSGPLPLWRHRETGTLAVSAERFPAPDYRTALTLAEALSQQAGNRPVYVFRTVESTEEGPVWRYSLVEPQRRDVVGKTHRVGGEEVGTGLDMSPEARKARAEAMGFDTSKVWYHGTIRPFTAFDAGASAETEEMGLGGGDPRNPMNRLGFFFTDDKSTAWDYVSDRTSPTARVLGLYIRPGRQKRIVLDEATLAGEPEEVQAELAARIQQARDEGYDTVLLDAEALDVVDGNELIVFDPANIRSVNAAFDLREEGSPELMASMAPTGGRRAAEAPPPAPGMVRVYHGGAPEVNARSPLYVTTSLPYAEQWASRSPGMQVWYTDLPANDPRVNNPDWPDQGVAQGFSFEFELTPEERSRIRPLRQAAAAPPPRPTQQQTAVPQVPPPLPSQGPADTEGTATEAPPRAPAAPPAGTGAGTLEGAAGGQPPLPPVPPPPGGSGGGPGGPHSAPERRRIMTSLLDGAPLDRVMRIPFDVFGGVDQFGRWRPGIYLSDRAEHLITSAEFSDEGRFRFLNPILRKGRAGLVDRYGLDPAYVERDRQASLEERAINAEAGEILALLRDEHVGPVEAKVLHDILTGEAVADADMARLSEPIRNAVDQMGAEAVELGLLTPESYERNRGAYLHRVYLKHETDQSGLSRFVAGLMGRRRRKLAGEELKGRGLWITVSPRKVMRLSQAALAARLGSAEIKRLEKRKAALERRLEIAEARGEEQTGETAATFERRLKVADAATVGTEAEDVRRPSSYQKGQVREQAVALGRLMSKRQRANALIDRLTSRLDEVEARIGEIEASLPGAVVAQKGQRFRVLDRVDRDDPGEGADLTLGEAEARAESPEGQRARRRRHRVYIPEGEAIPERYADYADRGVWEVRGTKRGKVILWRDFTKAEREAMGEITDARYTIAKTYMLMAHDLAVGRFYRDIAQNPDWAQAEEPEGRWVNAGEYGRLWQSQDIQWVKVPDTLIPKSATKRYGALAGTWVRAEIWRDLSELERMQNSGWWNDLLTQWKLNKTARGPVVHMNNVMSNVMLMDMAGVRARDLVRAIRSLARGDALYREAVENGAFGADMVSQEIRRQVLEPILEEISATEVGGRGPVETLIGPVGKLLEGIWSRVKSLDRRMVDLYRLEDEVFRLATYTRRRSQGMEARDAAVEARDQFLNYDIRAPWVNAARRSVLPFISYTYRAGPIIAKTVMTRPWKLAKYTTVAYALNALAYALLPGDEDEERRSMREEVEGYTWIGVPGVYGLPRMLRTPFADEYGNPVFLDVRRWIPAGDVFDISQDHSAISVPAWLQLGGPLLMGAELFLNKQAFTGKEIVNERTDDWWDRSSKSADYLYKAWMPSAPWVPGSWYWNKVGTAINSRLGIEELSMFGWGTEPRDWTGNPLNPYTALASSLGIKLKPQDVAEGFRLWAMEFERVERDLRFQMRRVARDRERGLLSQSQADRQMARIVGKLEGLTRDRRQRFSGAEVPAVP